MENFVRWLRPNGLIVLRIPDRDSVYGFFARRTPFKAHVFYHRWVAGFPDAGKPGHAPYPTVYDPVIGYSRLKQFCESNGLRVESAYGSSSFAGRSGAKSMGIRSLVKTVSMLSFGRLSATHNNLTLLISNRSQ